MKTTFFSELLARLSAPSPAFFEKCQRIGVWLIYIGTGLLTIPGFPESLKHISGYLITAGSVIKLLASLPVRDPGDLAQPAVNPENNLPYFKIAPPPAAK